MIRKQEKDARGVGDGLGNDLAVFGTDRNVIRRGPKGNAVGFQIFFHPAQLPLLVRAVADKCIAHYRSPLFRRLAIDWTLLHRSLTKGKPLRLLRRIARTKESRAVAMHTIDRIRVMGITHWGSP